MSAPLLLDERILADGRYGRTSRARAAGGRLVVWEQLVEDAAPGPSEPSPPPGAPSLPAAAVGVVLGRYGRPLDAEVRLDGPRIDLAEGCALRRLRYHAVVDATGRDYLVWEQVGREPQAALATTVAAALRFLVRPRAADPGGADPGAGPSEI